MLIELLQSRFKVERAETRDEREAIYRFRYTVYVEELGRTIGGVDHAKKTVHDEEDEKPYSHHLFIKSGEDVVGAVRVRAFRPGEVPKKLFEMLSLDLFPNIDELAICELGRFMIRPTMRGKLLLPALAAAQSDLIAGELSADLCFCYCRPGLVDYYRRLGGRTYGGRAIQAEEGIEIPLVGVVSDLAYLKAVGAPQEKQVAKYFGKGKRAPLDTKPFAHLLTAYEKSVVTDPKKIFLELQKELARDPEELIAAKGFLQALGEKTARKMAAHGFILSTPDGTVVTREGHKERELFVILEGTYEVFAGARTLAQMKKGEMFGEVAFFNERGRRSASVRAVGPGRVLVIRKRFVEALQKEDPQAACAVLFEIGRVLAARVSRLSSPAPSEKS